MTGNDLPVRTPYVDRWLQDPKGGLEWTASAQKIREHDRSCESLKYAWMPRTGGVSDLNLWDCEHCGLTMHPEGIYLLGNVPGEWIDQDVCHCCWKAAIRSTSLVNMACKENVVSSRSWWEPGGELTHWWKPLYLGSDENCNKILSIRLPGGVWNQNPMPRIRQKPCRVCMNEAAWEAFRYQKRIHQGQDMERPR